MENETQRTLFSGGLRFGYNLPLKHRTRETGIAIGASLGEVLEVDVADTGVQWGKCLRVHVSLDVSRKLIRGKRIHGEKGVD